MKLIKYGVFIALALFSAACNHKFDEYNSNPNNLPVGEITPDGMMDELICNGATGGQDKFFNLTGEFVQFSVSNVSTNAYHRYEIPNSVTASQWSYCAKWASNANHMYQLAVKAEDTNYQAIALTLRALYMSNLTDIYGYVPFSEAFGIREGIFKPKFDAQKAIYTQLLEDLELANSLYKVTENLDTPSKDRMYGGDTRKWQKFTNSLHLRLLMRLTNRADEMDIPARVRKIVESPVAYPVFQDNTDNATVYFTGETPFQNPFGGYTASQLNGRRPAEYFISYLDDTRDPRLKIFCTASGDGWKGKPSGMSTQETDTDGLAAFKQTLFLSYKLPYSFMKYDEVLFILAEAAQRGYIAGDARAYYHDAIDQSLDFWVYVNNDVVASSSTVTINDATRSDFHDNVEYDGTLECIINQKFVALFWTGYEAWHEYRRTGFPALKIGTGTMNDGVLPTRLIYPVNTHATNSANYAEAIANMAADYVKGGDDMQTPVWWSAAALEKGRR